MGDEFEPSEIRNLVSELIAPALNAIGATLELSKALANHKTLPGGTLTGYDQEAMAKLTGRVRETVATLAAESTRADALLRGAAVSAATTGYIKVLMDRLTAYEGTSQPVQRA